MTAIYRYSKADKWIMDGMKDFREGQGFKTLGLYCHRLRRFSLIVWDCGTI